MGQLGFFDADRRLAALSEKGDPLEAIAALVPWESFRAEIEAVVLTPDEAKKSKAGRKPFDAIMMFRMLVLQSLYNLSERARLGGRRAVITLLNDEEWSGWSDREIARRCAVDNSTVSRIRSSLREGASLELSLTPWP